MGIKFRQALSLLLTFVIIISSFVWNTAFADNEDTSLDTSFHGVYQSYMLFQQNKPIVLCGRGKKGEKITVKLVDKNNKTKRTASALVAENGSFEVTLSEVDGGYSEYSIIGYCEDQVFATLTNIVFGELWLCAGQSNMQFPLFETHKGQKILENDLGDYYIRGFKSATLPKNKPFASDKLRTDIPGSAWIAGNDQDISSISAIGYFFAQEIRKKTDVPVGILSVAIGGSSIFSWLSRTSINNSDILSNYLKSKNQYIPASEISNSIKTTDDAKNKMTYAYNQKVAPLKNLNISGTIWYQGEADINIDSEIYCEALKRLQKSYSSAFGFEKSSMPLICANLASYHYAKNRFQKVAHFNEALSVLAEKNKYISSIPIYDISLEYDNELEKFPGAVHPLTKEDVGERMAKSAFSMVYGEKSPTTCATVKAVKINGNEMHIKFDNVGNGLKIKAPDTTLYGFTICGESGIYVEARAVIENNDTIKVWSENVDNPVSATYAYSEVTINCNLFSTDKDGNELYPVASFNTGKELDSPKYMQSKDWATCEISESWHTSGHTYAGYFDTWHFSSPDNAKASLTVTESDKAYGDGSLKLSFNGIENKKGEISISPAMKDGNVLFSDINTNYSNLTSMTFKVKNNSDKTITIDRIDMWTSSELYYSPSVDGEMKVHKTIPANSDWVEVKLDLSSVFLCGNTSTIPLTNAVLDHVIGIDIVFSHINFGSDIDCEVLIDDITFASVDSKKANEQNITQKIDGFVTRTKEIHAKLEEFTNIFNSFKAFV